MTSTPSSSDRSTTSSARPGLTTNRAPASTTRSTSSGVSTVPAPTMKSATALAAAIAARPGVGAQRDLGAADAAAEQRFGEGHGPSGVVEHDDGDEALAGEDHRPSHPPSTGRIDARDVVRRRRGEEDRRAGDVLGVAPAAGGDAVEDRLRAVGVGTQRLGVVGRDVARGDAVDRHAPRRSTRSRAPSRGRRCRTSPRRTRER